MPDDAERVPADTELEAAVVDLDGERRPATRASGPPDPFSIGPDAIDDAIVVATRRTRQAQESLAADLAEDEELDGRDASTVVRRAVDLDLLAHQAALTEAERGDRRR